MQDKSRKASTSYFRIVFPSAVSEVILPAVLCRFGTSKAMK